MKAGDIIIEEQGLRYELKSLLGQGLWAKTFIAQTQDGVEWVLKIPLSPTDFPTGQEDLAEVCRDIAQDFGSFLVKLKTQDLLYPQKTFLSNQNIPVLVFKKTRESLEQKLRSKMSFQELVALCIRIADALDALPLPLRAHGNLHPRNIFVIDRHRIVLSDPITPMIKENYTKLNAFRRQIDSAFPPEVQSKSVSSSAETSVDTYCIASILVRGVTKNKRISLQQGITKDIRSHLQGEIINMLLQEPSNKFFHNRLCGQFLQFLNRALSVNVKPSPPYRFASLGTFQTRLANIYDLIEPSVSYIGQIILELPPKDTTFQTFSPVRFSCTIECTPKLDDIEEIDCGVRLTNRTRNERIKGYDLGYTVHTHPSGRLRFDFSLGTISAAQYTVKVAFKIKGSTAEVRTAQKDFAVEPEAGWVPEKREPRSPPIILQPDASQLQVLLNPQHLDEEEESSDITHEEAPTPSTPKLAVISNPMHNLDNQDHREVVSNSDPESFFPSEERIDIDSWKATPTEDIESIEKEPSIIDPPPLVPKIEPKKDPPKLIIRAVSPPEEPSSMMDDPSTSYDRPSYTFSQNIALKPNPNEEDSDSAQNPFGTTWEPSEVLISEDIPSPVSEDSEDDSEPDPIDQLKEKILALRNDPFHFFIAAAICVILILLFIINILL